MKLYLLRYTAVRQVLLLLLYSASLTFSLWLAYGFRFDFKIDSKLMSEIRSMVLWIVPVKLLLLVLFRQFEGWLSYFSIPDLARLFYALGGSFAFIVSVWFYTGGAAAPPRGVILADFVLSFMGLAAARLCFRLFRERYLARHNQQHRRARRVGIVGAGDVGASLARELTTKRGLGLQPVVFFDDNKLKWGSRVHNIPVIGPPEKLLERKLTFNIEEVIIAIPTATAKRIGEIVKVLQKAQIKFETVPSMEQLAMGTVKVSQLRNVDIEDLLGREPVKLDTENIRQVLSGKTVIVTGAGGSIGSELCRQIASFKPNRLVLVDQSEVQLFAIEQELISLGYGNIIVPIIADVCDKGRMQFVVQRFKPHVFFHAAAHKHVPMMENQPCQAIHNNTFGTALVAELAQKAGSERFVLVSTDKANNPTSVMGASKRLAEVFVQSLHGSNSGHTKFIAVRFGNVLGSSGSVIPTFHRQIAAGGPVTVTHPEVTRFFMTIPEAVGLVLQSCAQGQGGEIFVLDMGNPIKIVDLARQLIELTGLKPDEDIEIKFTGLRPGEKLYEEVSHVGENLVPTHHPKIMRFISKPAPLKQVRQNFELLRSRVVASETTPLKLVLKDMLPEYTPYIQDRTED